MLTKARIRQVRSLSDKTARSENGLFVAEGRKMVGEALAAGADIERIYLTGEEGAGGVDEAVRCGIVERVSDSEMERMSHLKPLSDMLAVIRMPPTAGRQPSRPENSPSAWTGYRTPVIWGQSSG